MKKFNLSINALAPNKAVKISSFRIFEKNEETSPMHHGKKNHGPYHYLKTALTTPVLVMLVKFVLTSFLLVAPMSLKATNLDGIEWGNTNQFETKFDREARVKGSYADMSRKPTYTLEESQTDADRATKYNDMGLIHFHHRDYNKAVNAFNNAIKNDPFFSEAFYNRGVVFVEAHKYHDAIEDFSKALDLRRGSEKAKVYTYYNRAVAYDKLRMYKEALDDYTKVLELDNSFVEAYNNRGAIYSDLKRYYFALEDFNHAINLDSKYIQAYYNRSVVYYQVGEYKKASTDFDEAKKLDSFYSDLNASSAVTF